MGGDEGRWGHARSSEVKRASRSRRCSSTALALSSSWLDAQSGRAGGLGVCASAPPERHGLAATTAAAPPPPAAAAPAAAPPPAGVSPPPLAQLVLNLAGLGSADEESGSAPASVAPPEELSCDACDACVGEGVCCEAREGEGVCAVLFFAEGSYDPADSVLFSSRGRFGAASRWLEYIPEAAVAAVRP